MCFTSLSDSGHVWWEKWGWEGRPLLGGHEYTPHKRMLGSWLQPWQVWAHAYLISIDEPTGKTANQSHLRNRIKTKGSTQTVNWELCSLLLFKEVLCTGVPPSNRKVWVKAKEWHGSLTTLPSIISNFNLTSNLSLRDYCKLNVEVANFWSRRVLISDSNWPDTKGKPPNVGGLFLDCVQAGLMMVLRLEVSGKKHEGANESCSLFQNLLPKTSICVIKIKSAITERHWQAAPYI